MRRDEVVVATKARGRVSDRVGPDTDAATKAAAQRRETLPNLNEQSRKHLLHAVDDSLRRLGLDYMDRRKRREAETLFGQARLTPTACTCLRVRAQGRETAARWSGCIET